MNWRIDKMQELILKGLGKKKVKSILNQFIKDEINLALEYESEFVISSVIYLNEYVKGMDELKDDPFDVNDLFKFIGNKI
tara:strand:+ start:280 stop:519 length:240 start_codon:yes stop_codon:yes gene_type:complete